MRHLYEPRPHLCRCTDGMAYHTPCPMMYGEMNIQTTGICLKRVQSPACVHGGCDGPVSRRLSLLLGDHSMSVEFRTHGSLFMVMRWLGKDTETLFQTGHECFQAGCGFGDGIQSDAHGKDCATWYPQ